MGHLLNNSYRSLFEWCLWIIFLTLKFIWVLSTLFWNFSSSLPEQLKDNIYMFKVWLPKQQYYDCTWFLAVLGIIKLEYISIINIKRLSIYFLFLPTWLDCLRISLGFLKIWYLQSLIPNIYLNGQLFIIKPSYKIL